MNNYIYYIQRDNPKNLGLVFEVLKKRLFIDPYDIGFPEVCVFGLLFDVVGVSILLLDIATPALFGLPLVSFCRDPEY